MNLGYGDMRYKVYLWGFSYLDYSLNILISWIRNLSLYNWFCQHLHLMFYLTPHCMFECACAHDTIFDICFSNFDLSIHVWLPVHVTWHSFYHLLGSFLTLLDLHVQILELELKWTHPPKIELILWSSPTSCSSSLSSLPLTGSRDFIWSSWAPVCTMHILYFILLHLQVI